MLKRGRGTTIGLTHFELPHFDADLRLAFKRGREDELTTDRTTVHAKAIYAAYDGGNRCHYSRHDF